MDEGCPVWRPRGPSIEDERDLRRVADMQRVMRQAMAGEGQLLSDGVVISRDFSKPVRCMTACLAPLSFEAF